MWLTGDTVPSAKLPHWYQRHSPPLSDPRWMISSLSCMPNTIITPIDNSNHVTMATKRLINLTMATTLVINLSVEGTMGQMIV